MSSDDPTTDAPNDVARPAADVRLFGDRIGFDQPWLTLLTLPVALACGALFAHSHVGRVLLVPFQIQFHELGHAVVAWLSSRAALPLPFGFTFWREERSWFTGACVVFLLAVLVVQAERERRRFFVVLGVILFAMWCRLSFAMSAAASIRSIIAAGIAGEFVLTTLVLVAFYFPLPDRLRWDFLRFLLVFPAAAAWLGSARQWLGIARGSEALPMGSLLGSPGDGSGDLERLVNVYGHSPQQLVAFYSRLCLCSAGVWLACYVYFATRAYRVLRQPRSDRRKR